MDKNGYTRSVAEGVVATEQAVQSAISVVTQLLNEIAATERDCTIFSPQFAVGRRHAKECLAALKKARVAALRSHRHLASEIGADPHVQGGCPLCVPPSEDGVDPAVMAY